MTDVMDLNRLNISPSGDVRPVLESVCASPRWVDDLFEGRPYADLEAVCVRSDAVVAALDDAELAAALAGHPRIGDRPEGEHAGWSSREQASMAEAAADVAAQIRAGNRAYEERFGHVYLVCASGRSPEELLAILQGRLDNDPATERAIVLRELAAINRLRLTRMLTDRTRT